MGGRSAARTHGVLTEAQHATTTHADEAAHAGSVALGIGRLVGHGRAVFGLAGLRGGVAPPASSG